LMDQIMYGHAYGHWRSATRAGWSAWRQVGS